MVIREMQGGASKRPRVTAKLGTEEGEEGLKEKTAEIQAEVFGKWLGIWASNHTCDLDLLV